MSNTPAGEVKRREKLGRAAALARDAMLAAQFATCAPSWEASQQDAERSMVAAMDCLAALADLGAVVPGDEPPPSAGFDLAALTALDTPESRELLAALERAQDLAERVDAQRGRCLPGNIPLQPGESRGTDLAESISELCLRLRVQIHGPQTGRE